MPSDFELPPGGLNIRWPDTPLEQERRLHGPKMAAVAAFARANRFDRIVLDPPRAALRHHHHRQGLSRRAPGARRSRHRRRASRARSASALYKVGLTWPLEPEGARRFAEGLEEVLVVEEKRGVIEDQLVRILYNLPAGRRPRVVGKTRRDAARRCCRARASSARPWSRAAIARPAGAARRRPAGSCGSAWRGSNRSSG